ncbi:MAG TPA: WYL domain-containing transcriptional regulator [Pirellulales bacterium]|nr:WYL domain-containing transcriptional regulator [Pirellulales bacterium]
MGRQTITFERKRSDVERRTKQAEKFVRLFKLLELLAGRGRWTPRDLAHELGCSQRELYRHISVLGLAGVFVEFDRKTGRYLPLRPDYRFPAPLALTSDELLGQAVAAAVSGMPALEIGAGAAAITRKLAASNPDAAELLAAAQQVVAVLSLKMVDHSGHREAFAAIQQALIERKQLCGVYRSPYSAKAKRVTLHPYRLCLARQAWYLIARADGEATPRNLRVVRFRSLAVIERVADVPDEFDLREHLGDAWDIFRGDRSYDVRIRFAKDAAAQVAETRWHHTQKVKRHRDGSVTLSFRVDGLDEILWWLLPWTGFAEVIEPLELRQRLVEQLQAGLRMNR